MEGSRRFLVVRKWGAHPDVVGDIDGRLTDADTAFDDVEWEHSHVVRTDAGEVMSYCIHRAVSAEVLRAHADHAGGHAVDSIRELGDDARPSDFVLDGGA